MSSQFLTLSHGVLPPCFLPVELVLRYCVLLIVYRHKTRLHIGHLAKETSAKLKAASESDHVTEVSVRHCRLIFDKPPF